MPGYYQQGDQGVDQPVPCPNGMISPQGSTDPSHCQCAAGTYKFDTTCIACPSSAHSAEGSTSIEDCICPVGQGIAARAFSRRILSPQDVCETWTP